jgi:hypothetical protein
VKRAYLLVAIEGEGARVEAEIRRFLGMWQNGAAWDLGKAVQITCSVGVELCTSDKSAEFRSLVAARTRTTSEMIHSTENLVCGEAEEEG